MIPRYAIGALAGIGLVAGAWFHGDYHGTSKAEATCEAAIQEARAKAAEKARAEEKRQQQEVNHALQQQNDELARINANQLDTIERLRDRPDRRQLSRAARTDCQGTTGAELSRQDGQFLAREAARADRLRAALKTCYTYADTVVRGE